MPSDITGTEVIYSDPTTNERQFKFLPGPIFSNIILADEINRTPPKTQAAMLESMQERKVSIGGEDHALPQEMLIQHLKYTMLRMFLFQDSCMMIQQ